MQAEQIALLFQLQQADSALAQRRAQLAGLDDGSQYGQKLATAKEQLQNLQQRLRQQEAESRRKELELKSAEEERKDKMAKAYGGMVADPKELAALERKIEELDRRRDRLETEILQLMDEMDSLRQQIAEQEKIVAEAQAIYDQIVSDYRQARARLEHDIKQLTETRTALLPQIEPALLREYEAMRAKLDGLAIAAVEGNLCQGCRTTLPQAALLALRQGRHPIRCENCHRLLFLKE